MQKRSTLSNSDWLVMESLWDQPMILAELILRLRDQAGWNKSTTATVVRRLTEKGLVGYTIKGRTKTYYPLLRREDACARETAYFLERTYGGSISRMVEAMHAQGALSEEELAALGALLRSLNH